MPERRSCQSGMPLHWRVGECLLWPALAHSATHWSCLASGHQGVRPPAADTSRAPAGLQAQIPQILQPCCGELLDGS